MEKGSAARQSHEFRSLSQQQPQVTQRQANGFKSHPVRVKRNPKLEKDLHIGNLHNPEVEDIEFQS
jgi:hypothetical protein